MPERRTNHDIEQEARELTRKDRTFWNSVRRPSEKEQVIQALLNAPTESVLLIDPWHGAVLACNDVAAKRLGKRAEEVIGLSIFDFLPSEPAAYHKKQGEQVAHSGKPLRYSGELEDRSYDIHMCPVFDPEGNVSSVAVYASDITERKQVEDVLRASEQRFRRFLENLGDAAYEADAHGNITYTNRMGEVVSGIPLKDLMGNPFLPLFTEQSQKVAVDVYQKTLRGESPEYELTFTNGTICQFKNAPLKDEHGRIMGVFGIARDITERKLIDRKLKESEEKYRVLVEHSQQGIAIAQGSPPRAVFINPAMARILGYRIDEITSFSAEETRALVHPEDREAFFGRFKDRLEGKELPSPTEVRGIRKDGSTVWLDVSSAPISYGGAPAIQGTFIDITDRKLAEEALQKAHDELESRVQARTADLERTSQELEIKTSNLEEMNTALRVLLKKRDEDRTEIEEKIITNIRQLIEPYIEKLRGTHLDEKQMAFVTIIQSNLADITSPFLSNLATPYLNLTPTEIQIADLIKQGRDTKEIATLLHLSWRTIKTHRRNIRSKLNLQNRKTNLRSYLMSFQ